MGVNSLWNALSCARPSSAFKSFDPCITQLTSASVFFRDINSVAIDCSIWMVENRLKTPQDSQVWLRNIIYRLQFLLSGKVHVIAVLESPTRTRLKGYKGYFYGSKFREDLDSLKKLLESLGIPHLEAPPNAEAEALCAALQRSGVVKSVITNDSDVFVYGATSVLRNFKASSSKKTISAEKVVLNTKPTYTLSQMRQELFLYALITGTDFGPGLRGKGEAFFFNIIDSEAFNFMEDTGHESLNDSISSVEGKALHELFMREFSIEETSLNHLSEPSWPAFMQTKLNFKECLFHFSLLHYQFTEDELIVDLVAIKKARRVKGVAHFDCDFHHQSRMFSFLAPREYLERHYSEEINMFERSKAQKGKRTRTQVRVDDLLTSITEKVASLRVENETVDLTEVPDVIDLTQSPGKCSIPKGQDHR